MYSKSDNCVEHPLGILCQCPEYQNVVDQFTFYGIGTQHCKIPKVIVEPIASAKVLWIKNDLTLRRDITRPVLVYRKEEINITPSNVNRIWIPIIPNLIPLKYIYKKL